MAALGPSPTPSEVRSPVFHRYVVIRVGEDLRNSHCFFVQLISWGEPEENPSKTQLVAQIGNDRSGDAYFIMFYLPGYERF